MNNSTTKSLDVFNTDLEGWDDYTLTLILTRKSNKWLKAFKEGLNNICHIEHVSSENYSKAHVLWKVTATSAENLVLGMMKIGVGDGQGLPGQCIGKQLKLSFRLLVPSKFAYRIIGVRGRTVTTMRATLGCDVFIPQVRFYNHKILCLVSNCEDQKRLWIALYLVVTASMLFKKNNVQSRVMRSAVEILSRDELNVLKVMVESRQQQERDIKNVSLGAIINSPVQHSEMDLNLNGRSLSVPYDSREEKTQNGMSVSKGGVEEPWNGLSPYNGLSNYSHEASWEALPHKWDVPNKWEGSSQSYNNLAYQKEAYARQKDKSLEYVCEVPFCFPTSGQVGSFEHVTSKMASALGSEFYSGPGNDGCQFNPSGSNSCELNQFDLSRARSYELSTSTYELSTSTNSGMLEVSRDMGNVDTAYSRREISNDGCLSAEYSGSCDELYQSRISPYSRSNIGGAPIQKSPYFLEVPSTGSVELQNSDPVFCRYDPMSYVQLGTY